MKMSPLGDSALLVDFTDESQHRETRLQRALSAAAVLERAKISGVVEITSAYQSIALFLDPTRVTSSALLEEVSRLIAASVQHTESRPRLVEMPVCYDEEFAIDAAHVASETRLSADAIIELLSSAQFTVACIGFMPGFPYLTGLPAQLRVPRLATPRTKVPAGSVAIANDQAGIYPLESPGGWNIVGRTPLQMFDPNSTPPTLLAAGDRVRFRKISRQEFDALVPPNEK